LGLDKRFSSLEVNAERAIKAVEEVEPEKVATEFKKIDKQILEIKAEIERVQTALDGLKKEGSELRSILEKIKNVENIIDVSRKIEEKLARVDDAIVHADRTSAKVEVVFTELSEKLGELERQKGKVARLDDLTKELVKMLDEISIRITKLAEKGEIEKAVEEATKRITTPSEQLTKLQQEFGTMKKKFETVDEVANRLMIIEQNLERLDKGGVNTLTEELRKIQQELVATGRKAASIDEVTNRLFLLDKKIEEIEKTRAKALSQEMVEKIQKELVDAKSLIEAQTEVVKKVEKENLMNEERIAKVSDAVKRLADAVSERLNEIERTRVKSELYFEILQITNMLGYVSSVEEINNYLSRVREIANRMKELGFWDERIQSFVTNVLLSLAEMWKAYEQEQLSQVYMREVDAYMPKERPA